MLDPTPEVPRDALVFLFAGFSLFNSLGLWLSFWTAHEIPGGLYQEFWGWGPGLVLLQSLLGDFSGYLGLRTIESLSFLLWRKKGILGSLLISREAEFSFSSLLCLRDWGRYLTAPLSSAQSYCV